MQTLRVTTADDHGPGSLRDAIERANQVRGGVKIVFEIGDGLQTLKPNSPLPVVCNTIEIDARTQPGDSPHPLIELDGSGVGGQSHGLHVRADGTVVCGLVVNRFGGDGIRLDRVSECRVVGNYVGTDSQGKQARGNGGSGIALVGSNKNTIGGLVDADKNLTSANKISGICIEPHVIHLPNANVNESAVYASHGGKQMVAQEFLASTDNLVIGNLVGTDVTGTAPLGNGMLGVWIINSARNTVGGSIEGARNLVSANWRGIVVAGPHAEDNSIAGNFIGTDRTGTSRLGNARSGVLVSNAPGTTIGGPGANEGNLISGNGRGGINIDDTSVRIPSFIELYAAKGIDCNFHGNGYTHDNVVQGNMIGTDVTGTQPLGNGLYGILLCGSHHNLIGGASSSTRNVISDNGSQGVLVTGATAVGNSILGNLIGTDITGTKPMGNTLHGIIFTQAAHDNFVGGAESRSGNVICGNGRHGIMVKSDCDNNAIIGNRIGVGLDDNPIGNSGSGIVLSEAPSLTAIRAALETENRICGKGGKAIRFTRA